jgi:hypothetical protein
MTSHVNLAYDYPVLGAFWTVFLISLAFLWIILLFRVITDIFRDDRLNGLTKTGWLLFVILLPFLGVFVYVIARGGGMGEREARHAQARQQEFDTYVRETAAGAGEPQHSEAAELERLIALHDKGAISDDEFQKAKVKVLH